MLIAITTVVVVVVSYTLDVSDFDVDFVERSVYWF